MKWFPQHSSANFPTTVKRVATPPVPLTLGLPPREPRPLTAGLLAVPAAIGAGRVRDVLPVLSATELVGGEGGVDAGRVVGADAGRVVVRLDTDPARLRAAHPARYEAVRFDLDCEEADLAEALAVRVPAPLAVFVGDVAPAAAAERIVAAGRIPGLPAATSPAEISDFLSVLAHSDVGYVARARGPQDVLALLCGTVAALRGDDTRQALDSPDPTVLTALSPEAGGAVREVLTGVEVPDAEPVLAMFDELGLGAP